MRVIEMVVICDICTEQHTFTSNSANMPSMPISVLKATYTEMLERKGWKIRPTGTSQTQDICPRCVEYGE